MLSRTVRGDEATASSHARRAARGQFHSLDNRLDQIYKTATSSADVTSQLDPRELYRAKKQINVTANAHSILQRGNLVGRKPGATVFGSGHARLTQG